LTIRRGFVDTSFGQLHYLFDGVGPPIILLHQSPQDSSMFRPIIPLLAPSRTVVALDTLGYGDSDPPATAPTIGLYANAVAEAVAELGFDRAPIHGYHTGSSIAIELAARHPERVSGLILGAIAYFNAVEREERLARLRARRYASPPVADDGSHFTTLYSVYRGYEGMTPERATGMVIDRLRLGERAYDGFEAAFSYDMDNALANVACPMLVLVGADDEIAENTRAARAKLGVHRYHETPGGRRYADMAPKWSAAILRFLDEQRL
jgi:pimeloyl-ACP methyl ester carboxylesterase